ncbi:MAG TPA: VOC family protein [Limnochordia bacterium]|nr:VOC family protein [Limnochordia bacterium]
MAIIGAHMLLYTTEPEALRTVLRDVFGWRHVDAGDGWLIFALPPAELGVHPIHGPAADAGGRHELTLMCDDIHDTVRELREKGLKVVGEPQEQRFGVCVTVELPGGVELLCYEPRHPLAINESP